MHRRTLTLLLLAALVVPLVGCRGSCGRRGLFSSASQTPTPCQTATSAPADPCCPPVAGIPVSGGTLPPGEFIPGTGYPTYPPASGGGSTFELPAPGGNIPPPNVPFAPPSVAPAPGSDTGAGVLPAPTMGVPVGFGN